MLPLGFHKRAEPAARAVVAAKAQGKGWAYDKAASEFDKLGGDLEIDAKMLAPLRPAGT